MLADVPEGLHTFFAPQMEQLRMVEQPMAYGGGATLREGTGTGYLWVAGLGEGCLVSVHDFMLHDDFMLHEFPTESYCLSLMSRTTANVTPSLRGPLRESNVVALYQDGADTAFTLPGSTRCWATTLCFTPRYIQNASALLGVSPDEVEAALRTAAPNQLPAGVRRCLEAIRPAPGASRKTALAHAAKAFEALALAVRAHRAAEDERTGQPNHTAPREATDARLVGEALRLMEGRLDQKLTLDALARELYVSKATLCTAFRAVKGEGAAECLGAMRIERAKELLTGTDLSIAEIAEAVGYRHQSSFCNAFKRCCGAPPSAFRSGGC